MITSFFQKNAISSFFITLLMVPAFIGITLPRKAEAIPVAVIADAIMTAFETVKTVIQKNTMIQTIINTAKAIYRTIKTYAIQVNTYLTQINTQILKYKEMYLDPIARYMSALLSNKLVQMMFGLVNGDTSGLEAYITDPLKYFKGVMEESTQVYLEGLKRDVYLLPSVRDAIRLKLTAENYVDTIKNTVSTFPCADGVDSCTVEARDTAYKKYLEDPTTCPTGDSWDCYFSILEPENDAWTLYQAESEKLAKKQKVDVDLAKDEIKWGHGYRSLKDCIAHDEALNCTEYLLKTPGDAIARQVDTYLSNALSLLQSADELDEIITDGIWGVQSFLHGNGFSGLDEQYTKPPKKK